MTAWQAIVIALIGAIPPTIMATATLISSFRNMDKLNDVHNQINGRMDQLIVASKAQGRQDERAENGIK